jgi:hypothetical protein
MLLRKFTIAMLQKRNIPRGRRGGNLEDQDCAFRVRRDGASEDDLKRYRRQSADAAGAALTSTSTTTHADDPCNG